MQDATFNQDFCGAIINYQLKKPPSVFYNVPMPPFWGPEDASITASLINVEIVEQKKKMLCLLNLKKPTCIMVTCLSELN